MSRAPDELLLDLLGRLRRARGNLDGMLGEVTDIASEFLGVERASLRLLDETRTRLLVAARTGASLHGDQDAEFQIGEGLAGWIVKQGKPLCLDDAENDPRFVAKPGMVARVGAFLGVPLLDAEGAIGVLAATSPNAFTSAQARWLEVIAGVATPYLDIARLHRIAITDALTLALNRRALEQLIPHMALDGDGALSVVLFDVDHFKAINDRLGHGAGDDVLRAVPRLLGGMLRRGDEIIRLGGDEFLIVLRGADASAAQQIASRACETVADAALIAETVTLSAGVAERATGETRDALLARADRALYRAKADGRNRAEVDAIA